MKKIRKNAFTLMETLVTVVILGIVAAILVPNLINRQVENANRTKVKKAMAVYEKAINYIIIENDIKSTEELKEFGEEENCKFSKAYFKTVQNGANDCIFKTADRVWWDITDLSNPLISLKDEITVSNEANIAENALSLNADKTSFALLGRFDDLGTLRVNDNAYEQGQLSNTKNKKYMAKLWSFATNTNIEAVSDSFALCKANNAQTCTVTNAKGEEVEYVLVSISNDYPYTYTGANEVCVYDRENKTQICDYTSSATPGSYYIKNYQVVISDEYGKSEENCKTSISEICETSGDYWNAAKEKCESEGARLPNIAELRSLAKSGKLSWGGYWSSEENNTFRANIVYSSNASVDYFGKKNNGSWTKVICVGNE